MPNNWFQFKQFKVMQEFAAMKVSTDACIQGAWTASKLQTTSFNNILDIGTGTGLLSLMLAQKLSYETIDAIELEKTAAAEAQANFKNASFININVYCSSLQSFVNQRNPKQYDLIICNPPFFHQHLQSQQQERNQARHSPTLTKNELATAVKQLLTNSGIFCVMYPQSEWNDWAETAANQGLQLQQQLFVHPNVSRLPNRIVGLFALNATSTPKEEHLYIYEKPNVYTSAFAALLHPFYLNL